MKRLFEIKSDCLDIVERIKNIDNSYYVVFNIDANSYELHSHDQRNSYCLTFPYDVLDERCILYTLKTRVENSDILFEELEKENLKQQQDVIKSVLNNFEEKIYDS